MFVVRENLMCGKKEINEKRMPKLKLIDLPIDDKKAPLICLPFQHVFPPKIEAQLNAILSKNRLEFEFLPPPHLRVLVLLTKSC
jgi:hypothetical protein